MQPLRKTLTALSPAIILVSVLCEIISGQSTAAVTSLTLQFTDGANFVAGSSFQLYG